MNGHDRLPTDDTAPAIIPNGALHRTADDVAMRLESDCESDFPHEVFNRPTPSPMTSQHSLEESDDDGPLQTTAQTGELWDRRCGPYEWGEETKGLGESMEPAAPEEPTWRSRSEVEHELNWLYRVVALSFDETIEAIECVRVRSSLRQAKLKMPLKEFKQWDRIWRDCVRLREPLVSSIGQSDVLARLVWKPEQNKAECTWTMPMDGAELFWLRSVLHLVLSTANTRRRIQRHVGHMDWHPSEVDEIRRRLRWSNRTLPWLPRARQFHFACLGEDVTDRMD